MKYKIVLILFWIFCDCSNKKNDLFEGPILLKTTNLNGFNYELLFCPSNATANESFILKKNSINLRVFENYDQLIEYKVYNSLLYLILSDTSSYFVKIDTFRVELK